MKPEAQRIAMADLDGPKVCPVCNVHHLIDGEITRGHPVIPDYLSNGDAVRAVARKLLFYRPEFGNKMEDELRRILYRSYPLLVLPLYFALSEASEITESVLRAAGKWVD